MNSEKVYIWAEDVGGICSSDCPRNVHDKLVVDLLKILQNSTLYMFVPTAFWLDLRPVPQEKAYALYCQSGQESTAERF